MAGAEIIDDRQLVALGNEQFDDMAANKPCTTTNENPHAARIQQLVWSRKPDLKGTPNAQYQVGFAFGGGRLYLDDVVGGGVQVADEAKPDTWTTLPTQAAEFEGSIKGPIYLEYDERHHILYSSNFEGGIWRLVTP
jgi:hypothetical protein